MVVSRLFIRKFTVVCWHVGIWTAICRPSDHEIDLIDLVVVNLYPFKETILRPDVTYDLAVENIDIGGPSCALSGQEIMPV